MLPIDEHAWGGDFVFAKFGRGFRVVRWDANPWVVALTFTAHHRNIDQMETEA